jgi:hypothetical protein
MVSSRRTASTSSPTVTRPCAPSRFALGPAGRLIVVEYDVDRSPWVPHPFSFASWRVEAQVAGYTEPVEIGRVPSRFLGAIYAAMCQPAVATAR